MASALLGSDIHITGEILTCLIVDHWFLLFKPCSPKGFRTVTDNKQAVVIFKNPRCANRGRLRKTGNDAIFVLFRMKINVKDVCFVLFWLFFIICLHRNTKRYRYILLSFYCWVNVTFERHNGSNKDLFAPPRGEPRDVPLGPNVFPLTFKHFKLKNKLLLHPYKVPQFSCAQY